MNEKQLIKLYKESDTRTYRLEKEKENLEREIKKEILIKKDIIRALYNTYKFNKKPIKLSLSLQMIILKILEGKEG